MCIRDSSYIEAGAGAAAAVERAAGLYAGRIRALEDDYMRERACDILDACYRIVDVLDDQPRQLLQLLVPLFCQLLGQVHQLCAAREQHHQGQHQRHDLHLFHL